MANLASNLKKALNRGKYAQIHQATFHLYEHRDQKRTKLAKVLDCEQSEQMNHEGERRYPRAMTLLEAAFNWLAVAKPIYEGRIQYAQEQRTIKLQRIAAAKAFMEARKEQRIVAKAAVKAAKALSLLPDGGRVDPLEVTPPEAVDFFKAA